MSLEINNIGELIELLKNTNLDINDPEELEQLLQTVNAAGQNVAERQRWQLEKQKEELAHQARLRAFDHEERMRSFSMGLEDPTVVLARIRAVRFLCGLVALLFAAGASVLSWRILDEMKFDEPQLIFLIVIWGVAGFLTLTTVMGGYVLIRRRRLDPAQGSVSGKSDAIIHAPAEEVRVQE